MRRILPKLPLAFLLLPTLGGLGHAQTFFGPLPYLEHADRPAGFLTGSHVLEDMEAGTFGFGLRASTGFPITPGFNTDSVDGDDGALDGSGNLGHSYFGAGSVLIEFPATVREAGVVWTDGPIGTRVEFEAFGPGMVSLGVIGPFQHSDGANGGGTGEDRFYGVRNAGGIVAIRLKSLDGNETMELDHVQFDTIGTSYCSANPNSTGETGVQVVVGSTAVADNDVALAASRIPRFAFGFFIASRTQGFAANAGGSAGNLCLGGSVSRFSSSIFYTGNSGSASLRLDLTAIPSPTGQVAVQPGETWNFQAWHRDSVGGQATSNFTDAVSVVFN